MTPDDTDIDSTTGDTEPPDADTEPTDAETARADVDDDTLRPPEREQGPKWGLPQRLSETVPDRRAYGLERMATSTTGGLFTPRERQYVQHVERLDSPDQTAVENVVVDRVDQFVDADWPLIRDSYPDLATALRDTICGEETD